MNRRSVTVWSVGLGSLAAAALAASRGEPVEATIPPNNVIPAAETVEPVLRATYVLPPGRSQPLAEFLSAHAAEGIDVRLTAESRLTVVAPEDAQKALGTFIEKCLRREPGPTLAPPIDGAVVPSYDDPFGDPQPVRKRATTPPNDGFQPVPTRRPGSSPFMEAVPRDEPRRS